MKNYEKYRKPLLERLTKGGSFGLVNGDIKNCCATHCANCEFEKSKLDALSTCSDARRAWLNAEAASTLTSDERKLCELLRTGYIAQDSIDGGGEICHYPKEPHLNSSKCWGIIGAYTQLDEVFNVSFKGVHDIRTKAWRVEDLLALEVCD